MSTATTAENTTNKLVTNYDSSKIFLRDNRFQEGTYTAGIYDITLEAGTVMGRITASGKVTPFESDASDGSQYPFAVLAETVDIAEGDDAILSLCVAGDVDEGMLVFVKDGDDLDTVVDGKIVRDRIGSDSVAIMLKAATENTSYDNQ